MLYKVLLVDDEEMVTQGLSRFVKWEQAGFMVAGTAASVAGALDLLEKEPVDLVITDVQMPGQNGLDLIEILNERYPQIKTIILSGYSEFSYAQKAIRLGALDYLTKPINFSAMMDLLQQVKKKLDEEKRQNGQDDQMRELLSNTMILNIANDLPYEQARAALCLNMQCPVRAVRLSVRNQSDVSEALVQTLKERFAPCQVVSPAGEELLCVLEDTRDMAQLDATLITLAAEEPPLCIGVSQEVSSYRQLRMAFLQAGKAMRYQKARSSAGVMLYEQVREVFFSKGEEGDGTVDELVKLISAPEDRPRLIEEVLQAISTLESRADFSMTRAQQFCTEFLVELDTPIQALVSQDFPRHVLLSEILIDVLSAKSLTEIKGYLVHYLERILQELRQADEAKQAGELSDRVKRYIQEHFAENLSLAVLSEIFYVCPTYLSRLFKKKIGLNFVDYLTALRMEKAKEFLANPDLMIYNISEMVGYENPRYFSRLFKEATGYSPQEYRNRLRNEGK